MSSLDKPTDAELRRGTIKKKLELKSVSLINSAYKLQEITKGINCFSESGYMESLKDFRKELGKYVDEYEASVVLVLTCRIG
jgi:hypothetical protein